MTRNQTIGVLLSLSLLACEASPSRPIDFEGGWAITSGQDDFIIITSVGADMMAWEDPDGTFSAKLQSGILQIPDAGKTAEIDSQTGRLLVTAEGGHPRSYERVPALSIRSGMDLAHSAKSMEQMRFVGTAILSWVTDQFDGPHGERSGTIRPVTRDELAAYLVPDYIQGLPESDGWGNPFEYHLAPDNPLAEPVAKIISGGPDGLVASESDNIEWADGYFTRYPGS